MVERRSQGGSRGLSPSSPKEGPLAFVGDYVDAVVQGTHEKSRGPWKRRLGKYLDDLSRMAPGNDDRLGGAVLIDLQDEIYPIWVIRRVYAAKTAEF
jgi:hypothetical protein